LHGEERHLSALRAGDLMANFPNDPNDLGFWPPNHLPGTFLSTTLPVIPNLRPGVEAYTSDAGPQVWNGATWSPSIPTSVGTFGADPTGLTDSTVAFNLAVANCKPATPFTGSTIAAGLAGSVVVPPGTYLLSSQIIVNGVTITWILADGAIITPSTSYAFLNGRVLRSGKQDAQYTNGIFYNATGFSTRNNVPIDSPPAVMGYLFPSQIATYGTKDSVGCYADNTGVGPVATIAGAGTTYTSSTIVFTTPLTATQLGQMRVGMIIQTLHDPVNFYDGFVTSWAGNGLSITVSGWFLQGVYLNHTAVTGGSAYTNGTYTNVPLTGGSGTGAKATIVVAGGAVTSATVTSFTVTPGNTGYLVGDVMSAAAANIGGTGSGFSFTVTAQTPPNAFGAYVSPTTKLWAYNGNVTLTSVGGGLAQQGAGIEMGCLNMISAPSGFIGTKPLLWGYDAVNLGTFACDTAFNARHNTAGFFTGFQVSGVNNAGTTVYGYFDQTIYGASATGTVVGFIHAPANVSAAASGTVVGFQASAMTLGGGGATLATQIGFLSAAMAAATNNRGFMGQVASGANNYNLYMSGTAQNYLAGILGVGAVPNASNALLTATTGLTGVAQQAVNVTDTVSGTTVSVGVNLAQSITASTTVANYRGIEVHTVVLNAGALVTVQDAIFVDDQLAGSTRASALALNVSSGANKYNVYAPGTAQNFFQGPMGINGAVAVAQSTGWGSSVGGAIINNYNITDAGGANSNTNKVVAQIITYLKNFGIFGA
jgi:hypothetical protein